MPVSQPAVQTFTVNVRDYGATGNGTTDDRAAIQAAIDAIPSAGGTVWFPRGTYKVNASGGVGLNLSSEQSITLMGEPAVSFNEGGTQGSQIIAGSSSMTLIKHDGAGTVDHLGPTFRDLGFYTAQSSTVLVYLADVNHWEFRRCNFAGSGATAIGLDLYSTSTGDNAYGLLDHCTWSLSDAGAIGLRGDSQTGGSAIGTFLCHSGNWNMSTGAVGAKLLRVTEAHFVQCKWNFAPGSTTGAHVYCEGGNNSFVSCGFEGHWDGTNYVVQIVRPASPETWSGKLNKLVGCTFASINCISLGANSASNQLIGNTYQGETIDVTDSGSNNSRFDTNAAQITPYSGGKLGFYGATPATKQTVTGSRGGNAALASLLSALNNYGIVTDSSSA